MELNSIRHILNHHLEIIEVMLYQLSGEFINSIVWLKSIYC